MVRELQGPGALIAISNRQSMIDQVQNHPQLQPAGIKQAQDSNRSDRTKNL